MERATALSFWASRQPVAIKPVSSMVDELALGEGRTNQNFIADAGGTRYFVRIGQDLPAWGVTRVKEQAAARAAAEAGIGAPVLHAELPDVLVTAFVDGRALTEAQVHAAAAGKDERMLHAITAAIRRLHATPLPKELADLVPAGPPRWAPP